jgi:PST family polysaccharide transporter
VRIALDVAWDLLVAVGRGKSVLWLNLLWFVLLVAGLTAGAHIAGIGGVGAAHLLVALVFVTPPYLIAIHRERIRLWRLARMLIRPAIGSCLVALSALVAVNVVDGAFWQLVVGGSISLVAYGIVVAPLRGLWNQSTAVNP